jgi:hypothetical protein
MLRQHLDEVETMVEPTNPHNHQVVDQFSKQAVYFAKLPGHEEGEELSDRTTQMTPRRTG